MGRELTREQAHHSEAFECYYALGEARSYAAVARKLGVSASTVKLWGRSFGWAARVRERDGEVAREVARRTVTESAERKERDLQIVHMALVQLARAIAEGDVKMSMSDLDRLLRLETFLRDGAGERRPFLDEDFAEKSDEDLLGMVREELEMLRMLEEQVGALDTETT